MMMMMVGEAVLILRGPAAEQAFLLMGLRDMPGSGLCIGLILWGDDA